MYVIGTHHVALVPILHHGSVWSSLTVQMMILRCAFKCHDQDTTDEDTLIQLLELYVQ